MRKAPPVSAIAYYPVTGGICLLAIAVTVAWMAHYSIEPFTMSGIHFLDQPWRMLTSIFPHGGIWHLAFNVYWTWVFGTLLEQRLGPLAFAAIVVLLAAGSGAAELALFNGGVGLSGVGYGLFGMLFVLSRREQRFAGVIDFQTIQLFVGWFLLCIVLTATNIMPVANVAHGMGGVLGALVGWVYTAKDAQRIGATAALVAVLVSIFLGATIFRTLVNFSQDASAEYVNAGCAKLQAHNPTAALALLNKAHEFRGDDGHAAYNLGVAYVQLDQPEKALPYFAEAVRRQPGDDKYKNALVELQQFVHDTKPPRTPDPPTPATHPE